MSTQIVKIVLGIPEDTSSNFVRLYEATTLAGTYTLLASYAYTYGTEVLESVTVDTAKFYKIAFYNSVSAIEGRQSDGMAAARWDQGEIPFAAFGSMYDGVPFTAPSDVYTRTGLTATELSSDVITAALGVARAKVDTYLSNTTLSRYTDSNILTSDVAKKKYNAQLSLMKDAELCYALSEVYRFLSDKKTIEQLSSSQDGSINIGSLSIGPELATNKQSSIATILNGQANAYEDRGDKIMTSLATTGVDLYYGTNNYSTSKFLSPTTNLRMRIY